MTAPSQNELLRDHINSIFDTADLTKQSERRSSLEKFLKDNPELKQHSATAAHQKQLEKIAKERNLDTALYRGTPRGKAVAYDPTLNPTINANPAAPEQGPLKAQPMQPGLIQHVPLANYSPEAIGAIFDGFYTGLRMAIPEAAPLDADEKKSLGEMWKPTFDKRLGGHENLEIVMAAAGTIGILGAKLLDGIGKRKKAVIKKTPTQASIEKQAKKEHTPPTEKESKFLEDDDA